MVRCPGCGTEGDPTLSASCQVCGEPLVDPGREAPAADRGSTEPYLPSWDDSDWSPPDSGLLADAPASGAGAAWPPVDQPPKPDPPSRLPLIIGVVAVLVVAGVAGFLLVRSLGSGDDGDRGDVAGEVPAGVTDARDIPADQIAVGDCIDWPDPDAEVIDQVIGIACGQPHDAEVYAIQLLAAGPDQPYPGFDGLLDEALDLCTVAFEDAVGIPYELDETYFFDFFSPTEESWAIGDREIVCLAYRIDEAKMTASVRPTSS